MTARPKAFRGEMSRRGDEKATRHGVEERVAKRISPRPMSPPPANASALRAARRSNGSLYIAVDYHGARPSHGTRVGSAPEQVPYRCYRRSPTRREASKTFANGVYTIREHFATLSATSHPGEDAKVAEPELEDEVSRGISSRSVNTPKANRSARPRTPGTPEAHAERVEIPHTANLQPYER